MGETANGRSMSVRTRLRPGKRNFPRAQPAARPNAAFTGTAIAATRRVSFSACRASGSETAASHAPAPLRNASTKTAASGTRRKRAMAANARPIRRRPDGAGLARARSAHRPPPAAHASSRFRSEEQEERGDEEDGGEGRRPGDVVLLELRHDEERGDLGLHRHVPRDEDDRAVLPEAAGEGERRPREERGEELGEEDAPERLEAVRSEARGGVLDLGVEAREDGLERPHGEGEAEEDERHADAERREGDRERRARASGAPEPAVRGVERRERDAGDGGRQGEGEVDEGVEEAPAGEAVPHEDPAEEEAQESGDRRGAEGEEEGEPQRRHDAGSRHGREERLGAAAQGGREERGERREDDEREPEERHAERRAEAGEERRGDAGGSHRLTKNESKMPPSSKCFFCAARQPPKSSSTVNVATGGKARPAFAAASGTRGR